MHCARKKKNSRFVHNVLSSFISTIVTTNDSHMCGGEIIRFLYLPRDELASNLQTRRNDACAVAELASRIPSFLFSAATFQLSVFKVEIKKSPLSLYNCISKVRFYSCCKVEARSAEKSIDPKTSSDHQMARRTRRSKTMPKVSEKKYAPNVSR